MYSTTIFITFWWTVKVAGALFLHLCHDSVAVTPSGEAAAAWGVTSANGLPRIPQNGSTSAHWDILHPRGGTEHSCLFIIWALGQDDTYHWIFRAQELSTTTGPPEKDQTFPQADCFNKSTSITPMGLQPQFHWAAATTLTNRVPGRALTLSV